MKEKVDKKINSLKYNSKEYNKCEMHFLFPRTFLRKKKKNPSSKFLKCQNSSSKVLDKKSFGLWGG